MKRLAGRITERSERGQSISVFVILVMGALIMVTGLVVDGGQKVAATSKAETAAAGAARAAANAGASGVVVGVANVGAAKAAANSFLAGTPGVSGSATVRRGIVTVTTQSSNSTIFLSIIGIGKVTGSGSATANLVTKGP